MQHRLQDYLYRPVMQWLLAFSEETSNFTAVSPVPGIYPSAACCCWSLLCRRKHQATVYQRGEPRDVAYFRDHSGSHFAGAGAAGDWRGARNLKRFYGAGGVRGCGRCTTTWANTGAESAARNTLVDFHSYTLCKPRFRAGGGADGAHIVHVVTAGVCRGRYRRCLPAGPLGGL